MVCCRHTFSVSASLQLWKVSFLTDRAQDVPHSESLAALASLLDQYATGSGRITPRPRGARLSEDVKNMLADALAVVESAANWAGPVVDLPVYGHGCYAVGRHAAASAASLFAFEGERFT